MRFIKVTRETIMDNTKKKSLNKKLKDDLLDFLDTRYEYAEVRDDEHHYNNNNDLRRAIQACIEYNDMPITVFMYQGVVYVQRLF